MRLLGDNSGLESFCLVDPMPARAKMPIMLTCTHYEEAAYYAQSSVLKRFLGCAMSPSPPQQQFFAIKSTAEKQANAKWISFLCWPDREASRIRQTKRNRKERKKKEISCCCLRISISRPYMVLMVLIVRSARAAWAVRFITFLAVNRFPFNSHRDWSLRTAITTSIWFQLGHDLCRLAVDLLMEFSIMYERSYCSSNEKWQWRTPSQYWLVSLVSYQRDSKFHSQSFTCWPSPVGDHRSYTHRNANTTDDLSPRLIKINDETCFVFFVSQPRVLN